VISFAAQAHTIKTKKNTPSPRTRAAITYGKASYYCPFTKTTTEVEFKLTTVNTNAQGDCEAAFIAATEDGRAQVGVLVAKVLAGFISGCVAT